jgi:signal transduction histidine kinase
MPEIRKSITQTYGLLGNLLDWIRSQMQGIEVLRDRLPVSRPLAAACSLYAGALEAKRINLELACPDGLSVCGDERMLETILRNLVSNAIKFSPPGGRVRISAEPAPSADAVVISVADEGIGMTPELRDTLFTTNLGRGKAGTAGEKGNGLGLMFSKDLALRMGGRLEVTSALGQGSVFRLTLPDAVEGELDRAE